MKKIFLLALLVMTFSLSWISCKSDNDDSTQEIKYYVKAKINGEMRVFNYMNSIGKSTNTQKQMTSISMSYNEKNPKDDPLNNLYPALYLKINEPTGGVIESQKNITITPRTFDEANDNVIVEFYKTSKVSEGFKSQTHSENDFTITITELGKTVKGTFKGTLENENGDKITVENGEFYSRVTD